MKLTYGGSIQLEFIQVTLEHILYIEVIYISVS